MFFFINKHFLFYKLEKLLCGLKEMNTLPDVVIIVSQNHEKIAVQECLKLNIPTITIVDSNCDPTLSDYVIPANDDSLSSVNFILKELTKSISSVLFYICVFLII